MPLASAHHVKEEQNEMFPKAKASSLDMAELGAKLAARMDELLFQTTQSKRNDHDRQQSLFRSVNAHVARRQ